MKFIKIILLSLFLSFFTILNASEIKEVLAKKKIAYIVSDSSIPFWKIISKGINDNAEKLGYELSVYNSNNNKKIEIENTFKAIKDKVDAIIISPINSSSAVTILKFAKAANIPVVISDIGADSGEYLSFISSNNEEGAYNLGLILAEKMKMLNWDKTGTVGIIAIPQKRANGKARTTGFMKAMNEANIQVEGLKKQADFTYEETYEFSKELIQENKNIKAIWLQGSDKYKATLKAIKEQGKEKDILLVVFDAEPEFLDLISQGKIIASAMQQPYLFGEKALLTIDNFFNKKSFDKHIQLPILAISAENIKSNIPLIKRNVLGILE